MVIQPLPSCSFSLYHCFCSRSCCCVSFFPFCCPSAIAAASLAAPALVAVTPPAMSAALPSSPAAPGPDLVPTCAHYPPPPVSSLSAIATTRPDAVSAFLHYSWCWSYLSCRSCTYGYISCWCSPTATSATTSAGALVSPFQLCCCSSLALVFPAVTDPDAISSPASPVLLLLLHLGFAGPNRSLTLESPT